VSLRVLLADDHEPTLVGMRSALEDAGMKVVAEVTNGPDAVLAAIRTKPDVALLDVDMPGGCGIEAAEQIARDAPGTAVVMLSGVPRATRTCSRPWSQVRAGSCSRTPIRIAWRTRSKA
jgi:DNA-binding NarL/FixJ family response regulator